MTVRFTANKWGYNDISITYKKVNLIGKAACRQVVYDCSFQKPLAYSQLPLWQTRLDNVINDTAPVSLDANPLDPSHTGSVKYVDQIEKKHPDYLRNFFNVSKK